MKKYPTIFQKCGRWQKVIWQIKRNLQK